MHLLAKHPSERHELSGASESQAVVSSGDGGGVPVEAPEAELVGQPRELRHLRGRQREVEQRQILRQVRLAGRLPQTQNCVRLQL